MHRHISLRNAKTTQELAMLRNSWVRLPAKFRGPAQFEREQT